jgi:glycosyl hydrolase group 75 (putative chitosanase)
MMPMGPKAVMSLRALLRARLGRLGAQKDVASTRHTWTNENISKSLKTNNRHAAGSTLLARCGAPIVLVLLFLVGGVAIGQNLGQSAPELGQNSALPDSCARSVLLNFPVFAHDGQVAQNVPIWQAPGSDAFFFVSGMTIDADGAPNAYHPDNSGLDDIANAGAPGHWDGIITDRSGEPLVQGHDDPFPGYYVSCTSLSDRTKARTDPARYVDASKIPYIVLPRDVAQQGGAQLGDFAVVVNLRNGKSSYAIFADVGTLGEGSIALADNLGIWSDARQGGRRGGILYLVFPGSGNRQPRTVEEISNETDKLLQDWGGAEKLTSCSANQASGAGTAAAAKAADSPAPSSSSPAVAN